MLHEAPPAHVHLLPINKSHTKLSRQKLLSLGGSFQASRTTALNDYTFELASTQFIFISAIFHAQRAAHTQMQAINKLQKHTATFDLYVTVCCMCALPLVLSVCVRGGL